MFAECYLEKQVKPKLIPEPSVAGVGIIIVIPCFREPDILLTLNSLTLCTIPGCHSEVIILINHSETADLETKNYNWKTKAEIEEWIKRQATEKIKFFCAGPVELPKKWAGVGVARKYGMDEALRRFNELNKPQGIIVSLDADTLVDRNYLVEIERYFFENPAHAGCTIDFDHQKERISENQKKGILLYEKYLHYYRDALEYAGYPWPIITIGSAFAVTAHAYVKRGGMTRRKAGEDFYFLQNLVLVGTVGILNTTKVHPSSRESDRVPFGTGPAIRKWINGQENLQLTYSLEAFMQLRYFFSIKNEIFRTGESGYLNLLGKLDEPIRRFLILNNFKIIVDELNQNCSSLSAFEKRFFQKFNAFLILKFVHFATEYFFPKEDIDQQCKKLNMLKSQNNPFPL
jgi:glycosyltransferase involved in cell wall biosynthesis